jgi:hypothetical protein
MGESERTFLEKIDRSKPSSTISNALKPRVDDQIFSKLPLRESEREKSDSNLEMEFPIIP